MSMRNSMGNVHDKSLVAMGRVVAAFGVNGWLKLKIDNPDSQSFATYKRWYIKVNDAWQCYQVEQNFVRSHVLHVKLIGVATRDEALALRGCDAAINKADLSAPAVDEYYWVDLINLKVYNLKNIYLGIVDNLMDAGVHSVLIVKDNEENKERLIPFVAAYINQVNLAQGLIIVEWEADY